MAFKKFGWWGFEVAIPDNWDISIDRGGYDKGYVRIDDPKVPRLEISWEPYKKDKIKSLDEISEDIKKELRKKSKDIKFIGKGGSARIAKHTAKYLHWRIDEFEGYVVFWYCDGNLKFYRVQLLFKRDEYWSFKKTILDVLKSFKCHVKSDVYSWTVLDFNLKLPKDFKLISRSYKLGNITLAFESKNSYIFINRISVADVLLEEKYEGDLINVLENEHLPNVKTRLKISKFKSSRSFQDEFHSGLIMSSSYKIGLIMPKEFSVRTRIWLCKKANKIYAVTIAVRKSPESDKFRRRLETLLSTLCP
ncbi:MAG: hypothetical protein QXI36_04695 [Candidatus Bathyarchaeia archaeon]